MPTITYAEAIQMILITLGVPFGCIIFLILLFVIGVGGSGDDDPCMLP